MCRKMEGTDYRDFALVQETDTVDGQEYAKKDQNFPVRLHYMLSEMEKDGLQHIVSWQPHGRCFIVHDQQEFVKSVLPMWFRQTKFPSFQRQLNIYGFTRIAAGPDKGAYYHELFLRGKQFLAQRIDRVKGGHRKQQGSKSEPNFYRMPPLPPSEHEQASAQSLQAQSPLLAASGASMNSVVAAATAAPTSANSLRLALQDLQGNGALQNLLLQQASPELLLRSASQSSGLVEALLARRQLEQALLLHPTSLSLNTPYSNPSNSSLLASLLSNPTEAEPNPASTDASSSSSESAVSSSTSSSSKLPPGLEALCAATDSTLAIRALEAAAQQRLQQQQTTELLLARLMDGNHRRPGGQL